MCLAAIQFVAIAWFNYRHVYGALDMDAAMGIRQNIEQWKHGLFLEDFIFATTLSNDYVSFWAVPFYFLSGNLNLAMMLSQCLTYFIIVLILWDICSGLELTIDQYLFSVILIFTPYSLDVLEWAYLLFISVGYYAYRVIALLLLFDLLLNCSRPNTGKIKLMILLISSCAVTFWTSLSTGNYILCMVVLPMILKVAWDVIEKQRFSWKNSENWAILLNIISGLMGWIVRNQNMYEIGRNHNDLSLLTADNIFKNLPNAISGFLMLLGGLTNLKDVSIFSWFGLLVLIRLLFIFISIIVVVRACIHKCAKDSLHKVFLCVAVVNIGVLLLTNTSYSEKIFESRYHLVWCIPFLLVVATNVMKAEFRNQWLNHLFAYGFVIIAVVINTGGFYYLHCQTKEKVREQEIIRMADELGIDNVFIYDDPTSAYVLRAMDMEKNIVSVTQERGYMAIHSWGFYASTMENAVSNGPNILSGGDAPCQ